MDGELYIEVIKHDTDEQHVSCSSASSPPMPYTPYVSSHPMPHPPCVSTPYQKQHPSPATTSYFPILRVNREPPFSFVLPTLLNCNPLPVPLPTPSYLDISSLYPSRMTSSLIQGYT